MSDVRSDPRTPRLLDAVPGVAESLSDGFASLAHQAQDVSGGLAGAQSAKDWTGEAADQYRTSIHHRGGIRFPGTSALHEEVEGLQQDVDEATDPAQKAAFEALLASAENQAATVGAVNSSLSKIIGQQIGAAGSAADPRPTP